jgi:glycosyltransferase involved in cell wall biosynthesis
MIVKNEEKYLEGCLESVKNVADEIVIVDTGSEDSTLDIAERYGAKIYHFEWIDDFSAARNFALSKSTGDWILYLDADERLSKDSFEEVKSIISSGKKYGVLCKVRSHDDAKGFSSVMKYVRLFKNDSRLRFSGSVHEQIVPSLDELNYEYTDSGITIYHYGYSLSKDEFKTKAERNLEILLKDYAESPTSYLSFQIAQSFAILEKGEEAESYFLKMVDDEDCFPHYRVIAYRYIAGRFMKAGELVKAKEWIEKGISLGVKQPLLYMVASQIYDKLNDHLKTIQYCKEAFSLNSNLRKEEADALLDMMIEEDQIAYRGITYSLKYNNKEAFNYFFDQLKNLKGNDLNNNAGKELELVELLLNNSTVTSERLDELLTVVNDKNAEFFLKLIDGYNRFEGKLQMLNRLSSLLPNNSVIKNSMADNYISRKMYSEASDILEDLLQYDSKDPKALFNLISIYIQQDKMDRVYSLINTAKIEFQQNKLIQSKINSLENRLEQYLIKIN